MAAMRLAVFLCGGADGRGHRGQGNSAATPAAGNAGVGAWGGQSHRAYKLWSPPVGQVERLADPDFA
jgi:hypothetical protein